MSDTILEELTLAEKSMLDAFRAKCQQAAAIKHDYLTLLNAAANFAEWEYTAGGTPFSSTCTMFTNDFKCPNLIHLTRTDARDVIHALMHLAMAGAKPTHLRTAEESAMFNRVKAFGGTQ